MSNSDKYMGSRFLRLKDEQGRPLHPASKKGGPWLFRFGEDPSLMSRATRAITGHAPIGEYYARFNIPESHRCACGCFGSRDHILNSCRVYRHKRHPASPEVLVDFLNANSLAFGFQGRPPNPLGSGGRLNAWVCVWLVAPNFLSGVTVAPLCGGIPIVALWPSGYHVLVRELRRFPPS